MSRRSLDSLDQRLSTMLRLGEIATARKVLPRKRLAVVPGAGCPVPGCNGKVNDDWSTEPCGRGGCPLGGDL